MLSAPFLMMLLRLRLLLGSLLGGSLLLAMLCLGAQNLERRERLTMGVGQPAPLPSGSRHRPLPSGLPCRPVPSCPSFRGLACR